MWCSAVEWSCVGESCGMNLKRKSTRCSIYAPYHKASLAARKRLTGYVDTTAKKTSRFVIREMYSLNSCSHSPPRFSFSRKGLRNAAGPCTRSRLPCMIHLLRKKNSATRTSSRRCSSDFAARGKRKDGGCAQETSLVARRKMNNGEVSDGKHSTPGKDRPLTGF